MIPPSGASLTTPLHILIVEDQRLIADLMEIGIHTHLKQDERTKLRTVCIRIAATQQEAHQAVADRQPELAIIDIMLPDGNGLDLAKRWAVSHPDIKVVVCTGWIHIDALEEIAASPIKGVVIKPFAVGMELAETAVSVLMGTTVFPPKFQFLRRRLKRQRDLLSQKESAVLGAMSRGLSDGVIAEHLQVTPHAIRKHRRSLWLKLGVDSDRTLLAKAYQEGWVSASTPPFGGER